jgi:hypothetical protein
MQSLITPIIQNLLKTSQNLKQPYMLYTTHWHIPTYTIYNTFIMHHSPTPSADFKWIHYIKNDTNENHHASTQAWDSTHSEGIWNPIILA